MADSTHHRILGLESGADASAIRRAFHDRAWRDHPDRNPGDPGAAERFRAAHAAYSALMATAPSPAGQSGNRHRFRHADDADEDRRPNDPRAEFARGFDRLHPHNIGRPLEVGLTITLEEALAGCRRETTTPLPAICERCAGSGDVSGNSDVCASCRGTGRRKVRHDVVLDEHWCRHCRGRGRLVEDACPDCGGNGRCWRDTSIVVDIPPGTADDQVITIAGGGEAGLHGAPAGDLWVRVRIASHPLFQRRGRDLEGTLEVPVPTAVLGGSVALDTIDGDRIDVEIPSGTGAGERLTITGRGFCRSGGYPRGDLHLEVKLVAPKRPTLRQRALLEELAATMDAPLRRDRVSRCLRRLRRLLRPSGGDS